MPAHSALPAASADLQAVTINKEGQRRAREGWEHSHHSLGGHLAREAGLRDALSVHIALSMSRAEER